MNTATLFRTDLDSSTLIQTLAVGILTELDYMTPDAAQDAIELEAFLASCAVDELDAAIEFCALAAAGR